MNPPKKSSFHAYSFYNLATIEIYIKLQSNNSANSLQSLDLRMQFLFAAADDDENFLVKSYLA